MILFLDSRTLEQVKLEADMLRELEKDEGTMTLQDKVYMKDIWNKTLGWIELTVSNDCVNLGEL